MKFLPLTLNGCLVGQRYRTIVFYLHVLYGESYQQGLMVMKAGVSWRWECFEKSFA